MQSYVVVEWSKNDASASEDGKKLKVKKRNQFKLLGNMQEEIVK